MVTATRVAERSELDAQASIRSRRSLAESRASEDLESYRADYLESSHRASVEKLSQAEIPEKLINSLRNKAEGIVKVAQESDFEVFENYCKNKLHLVDDRAIEKIYELAIGSDADKNKAIEFTTLLLNPSYGNLPISGASNKMIGDRQVQRLFTRYEIAPGNYAALRDAVENDKKYDCSGNHSKSVKRSRERAKERILSSIDSAEMKGDAALDENAISTQSARVDNALSLIDQDISYNQKLMQVLLYKNSSGVANILKKWGNEGAFREHIATVRENNRKVEEIDKQIVERDRAEDMKATARWVVSDMKTEQGRARVGPSARQVYYDAINGNATGTYAEALREAQLVEDGGIPIAARISPTSFSIDHERAKQLLESIQRGNAALGGGTRFGSLTERELHNMLHYLGTKPDPDGRGAAHAASLTPDGGVVSEYHKLRVEGFYRFVETYANRSTLEGEHQAYDNVLAFLEDSHVRALLQSSVGINPKDIDRAIANGAQIVPGIPEEIEDEMKLIDSQMQRLDRAPEANLKTNLIEAIRGNIDKLEEYIQEVGVESAESEQLRSFIDARKKILNKPPESNVPLRIFREYIAIDGRNVTDAEKQAAIQALKTKVEKEFGPNGMKLVVDYAKRNWNRHDTDRSGNRDPWRRRILDEFFQLA